MKRLLSIPLQALLLCSPFWARAEDLQVVRSGKRVAQVHGYRVDQAVYLGVREIAEVYGGRLSWFSVSRSVVLSFHGRKIVFRADEPEAAIGSKKVPLGHPVLLRGKEALVPVDFLTGREFSALAGMETQFDPKTRVLSLEPRSSVGPLRWFSYADHTRIVLELEEGLAYKSQKRGIKDIDVTVQRGVIDESERADIRDGVVEAVDLEQGSKAARLLVRLYDPQARWMLTELSAPRRLVVDVSREKSAPRPRNPLAELAETGSPADSPSENPEEAPVEISAAPIEPLPRAAESVPAAPPAPAAVRAGLRRIRVAVDAGHGGKDGGAPGRRGTLEKDVNLAAARDLANLLEEEKVFDVFLTRRTDEFVPLADRARLANEWKADLFVSLHCNAHRIKSENGFEIYFLSEKASDPEAERLAEFENSVLAMEDKDRVDQDAAGILYALARTEFINEAAELAGRMAQSAAGRVNIANRGVKQAGFYVLRGVNAPAVLVEMGFLSNTEDEAKLGSRKVRRRMVEGLYAGIVDFSRRKLTDGRAH